MDKLIEADAPCECWGTDKPLCPECQYKQGVSPSEFGKGESVDTKCRACGQTYRVYRTVKYEYTTMFLKESPDAQ